MSTTTRDITVRRQEDRGKTEIQWLHGRHSFWFGRYYDPNNLGYRSLRADQRRHRRACIGFRWARPRQYGDFDLGARRAVAPSRQHGQRRRPAPGELQAMTAGRGIRHSEVNDSPNERVHLLQISIQPDTLHLPPRYGQKSFAAEGRQAKWQTLASPDGRDGSMKIHQDATLQVTDLSTGQKNSLELRAGHNAYIHHRIRSGSSGRRNPQIWRCDRIQRAGTADVRAADDESQILYFDLA